MDDDAAEIDDEDDDFCYKGSSSQIEAIMEQQDESETPNHKILDSSVSNSRCLRGDDYDKDEGKRLSAKYMGGQYGLVSGANLKVLEESRLLIERTN